MVKDLSFSGTYTGIDLSPTIIERNRTLRPDWTFVEGDFLEWARDGGEPADLVICFDVLIHQQDATTYRDFVRTLINGTRKVALINGFEKNVHFVEALKICAFHEPLSVTLSDLGVDRARRLGRFRRTTIYRIDKESTRPVVGGVVDSVRERI
ncbi:MAG: class I SAM-dependent methyltransferase [Chloroflexota bacterium]|nr:class I SAM-dependent methyltransferase [Chloroflexota bacterium]